MLTGFSEVIYFSIEHMAEAIGVSAASIVRFARTLGFTGFLDFQEAFFEYHKKLHSPGEQVQHLRSQYFCPEALTAGNAHKSLDLLARPRLDAKRQKFFPTLNLLVILLVILIGSEQVGARLLQNFI